MPHPSSPSLTPGHKLAELTESIRSDGLAQPPLVRPHGRGYQVVAGHRRVEAYRRLAEEDPATYGVVPSIREKHLPYVRSGKTLIRIETSDSSPATSILH